MAGTVSVVIADDLDGSPGARAMAVSFDGRSYQIDLGKKNRARFRKSPQPLTEPAAGRISAEVMSRYDTAHEPRWPRSLRRAIPAGTGLARQECCARRPAPGRGRGSSPSAASRNPVGERGSPVRRAAHASD